MKFKRLLGRIKLPPTQLTCEERLRRPPSEIPRFRDVRLEIALAIAVPLGLSFVIELALSALGIHGP